MLWDNEVGGPHGSYRRSHAVNGNGKYRSDDAATPDGVEYACLVRFVRSADERACESSTS